MNKDMVVAILNGKKNGAFVGLAFVGDLEKYLSKSGKDSGVKITKYTKAVARTRIKYENMKVVKEKVANGYELTHELKWGEWSTEEKEKDLIIYHKGKSYVRLYTTKILPKTKWYMNGKRVTKRKVKKSGYVQPSYFKKTADACYTLQTENVVYIK